MRAFRRCDVRLRRARGVGERGVAGVEMGEMGDLVGSEGAAAAGMVGPAEDAGFEEGAVDDQLTAALEEVEQAHFAVGPIELVLLLDGHPWHPPALGSQRITGAGQLLLLHEQLLAGSPHSCGETIFGVSISFSFHVGGISCGFPKPDCFLVRKLALRRRLVQSLPVPQRLAGEGRH